MPAAVQRLLDLLDESAPAKGAGPRPSRPLWPSQLVVPLTGLGRVLGVLAVGREAPGAYGEEEENLLAVVAAQLGAYLAALRVSETGEARLRALLEAAPDAAVTVDAAGRIVLVNARAEGLFGYDRRELLGQPVELLLPERFRAAHVHHRAGYQADRRPRAMGARLELMGRRRDGSEFPAEIGLSPLELVGGSELVMAAVRDVSERKQFEREHARLVEEQAARAAAEAAQQRLAFLAEASRLLAESLAYETTLQQVAQLAIPRLADWCAVDVVGQQGQARRLAMAHADPAKVRWAQELQRRYPPDPNASVGVAKVLRTGRAEYYPEIPDSALVASARDAEHLRLLRQVGVASAMIVPLVARGRTLGALTFVTAESGRRYTPVDLTLAEELGCRAALAVDNARLHREVQQQVGTHVRLNAALREAAEARSRALAEAEGERARLNSLFVQAPAAIAELRGPEHVFTFVNPLYLRLVGRRDPAVLLGRPVREALPELCGQGYAGLLDRVYQTGEPWIGHEVPVLLERLGEGAVEEAFMNVVVQPVRGAAGQIVGLQTYALDVTELLTARRRAEALRERLTLAQAAGRLGAFEWNIQSGEVVWTPELEALYGLPPGSFGGDLKSWLLTIHPDDRAGAVAAAERAVREGVDLDSERRVVWPDGTLRHVAARARVFRGPDGAPQRMVGVCVDITERKQAEEARERALAEAKRRRDEAEQANASLQTFLGVVAHDLRSPLTAILGNVQLLRRARTSDAPERQARVLELIEGQVRRMNGMIGHLVNAARVGRGQLKVRPEPTDLMALLRRVVLAAQATTERHRIVLEGPERLEGEWDPGWLAQVLDNLLGNAIKYSPAGGRIAVRLRLEDGQAVLSVTDQGIGLHPEHLPRLFSLFSRLETGGGIEGSGLGLYIVRGIVEAHGGRVWAESAGPGQGSTFSVALPLRSPRGVPPAPV